ncbi:MAG: phospholipase, partial [Bacteroidota bacterium]
MSYGLFIPENYDPNVSYPLVMAAHGAGERGTDLRNLPPHRLATSWADPVNQANNPAFVYAPQVPSGLRWTTDADPDQTDYVAIQLAALDALSQIEAEFNIDPDRIYVV